MSPTLFLGGVFRYVKPLGPRRGLVVGQRRAGYIHPGHACSLIALRLRTSHRAATLEQVDDRSCGRRLGQEPVSVLPRPCFRHSAAAEPPKEDPYVRTVAAIRTFLTILNFLFEQNGRVTGDRSLGPGIAPEDWCVLQPVRDFQDPSSVSRAPTAHRTCWSGRYQNWQLCGWFHCRTRIFYSVRIWNYRSS